MFSGLGGVVYAEMALERAWIAGGAWSCAGSPVHFTAGLIDRFDDLSTRFPALCSRSDNLGND